jgi:hypothetical protein
MTPIPDDPRTDSTVSVISAAPPKPILGTTPFKPTTNDNTPENGYKFFTGDVPVAPCYRKEKP